MLQTGRGRPSEQRKANTCSRPPTRLNWLGYGPGRAGRPRGEGAQPQGHHRPAAAPCADLRHRPERLRQVQSRLRHDLRGGAAPLRREPLGLRAPVPADDGEAGRRLDRRALAGDLDRPEDHLPEPAFDRRDGHGDLRLPAPALRPHRQAPLPGLRPPDRRPEPGGDRRPDPPAAGGDEVHRQRAGRPRPQGRVQGRLRGAPGGGVHAREGGRRATAARRGDRARQEVQAHDRGGRGPARDEGRPAAATGAVGRDRGRAGRRPGRGRRARRRADDVQRELRLSRARCRAPGARAADLLVQLATRRVPALHRPRCAAGDRPRPARPRPVALDRRRRARAVVARQLELLRVRHPGDRRPLRDRSRGAVVGAPAGAAEPVPVRDGRRQGLRPVPQPDGPAPLVHARLRGHRGEPRAPLPRDRLEPAARAHRGVHELPAVPGLRRRATQARGAGGDGRQAQHPRVHPHVGAARDRVRGRARAEPDRAADRGADPEGDPRAPDISRERRRRLPAARPGGLHAERRRGAAAAARDTDRQPARRRSLHPRRAVDRPAPAGQREADHDPRATARPGQHRARGGARRADDARRRPSGRHGAWGRRARRPRRRRGVGKGRRAQRGVGHGPVPLAASARSRSRSGASRTSAPSPFAARGCTT